MHHSVFDHEEDEQKIELKNSKIFKRFLPYLLSQKKSIIFTLVLLGIIVAINISLPMILKKIIDQDIPSGDFRNVISSSVLYLALFLLSNGFSVLQGIIITKVGYETVTRLKGDIFDHILSQSLPFFQSYTPGKLLARVESDTEALNQLFSNISLDIFRTIITFFAILIILFLNDYKLSCIILFILICIAISNYFIIQYLKKLFLQCRKLFSQILGLVTEYIQSVTTIQLFSYGNKIRQKIYEKGMERFRLESRVSIIHYGAYHSIFTLGEILSVAIVFFVGGRNVFLGTMTIGGFVMFVEYVKRIYGPMREFSEFVSTIQRSFVSAGRLFSILDRKPDIVDPEIPLPIVDKPHILEMKEVSFSYKKDTPVLKRLSFSIKQGEMVALVGPSGAGKSTIANLLMRFYDPLEGEITLNGTPIQKYAVQELRSKFALVLQEVYLFPGTIMENLKVLNSDIPDEKIRKAAKLVNAHDFIEQLPQKYDTVLSERGENLSMGERQLLSFARAMLLDPEIIILDEATSSVDPTTEKAIQQGMEELLKGRMSLVIAHRLSTIAHANKIIVLEKGEKREEGTHEDLIKANGLYKKSYELQKNKEIEN
ncbi:MAG: ABC transporter ATP-binding protein [Candidatus Brocadiae bacterium]|nr:ABC transporter ATP-binding protein [Candidatus Brocadiia bacterium]